MKKLEIDEVFIDYINFKLVPAITNLEQAVDAINNHPALSVPPLEKTIPEKDYTCPYCFAVNTKECCTRSIELERTKIQEAYDRGRALEREEMQKEEAKIYCKGRREAINEFRHKFEQASHKWNSKNEPMVINHMRRELFGE